jgi:hypothetical protein
MPTRRVLFEVQARRRGVLFSSAIYRAAVAALEHAYCNHQEGRCALLI